ncbi:late expression factor 3 [Adoxophyes honmai nucleopolyhedrovirus]|uniref:Late expression factor 3 n=1 Tax=Adoxophyes honmai nucleopolyhedrovirus TaxID=224399 RepID=Q80LP0_NPVAH|nr:late expression factor 3 [Adoxophyes honmai nucleopolyhedrovirus]BAC67307.1 late expression factor 3 [Adoxophyes honmai nucleopolyhedrovirus]
MAMNYEDVETNLQQILEDESVENDHNSKNDEDDAVITEDFEVKEDMEKKNVQPDDDNSVNKNTQMDSDSDTDNLQEMNRRKKLLKRRLFDDDDDDEGNKKTENKPLNGFSLNREHRQIITVNKERRRRQEKPLNRPFSNDEERQQGKKQRVSEGSVLEDVMDVDVQHEVKRRESKNRRMSNMSVSSVSSSASSSLGSNVKSLTGELINKNFTCINNQTYYLFKFFVDGNNKEYYGYACTYDEMKENVTYNIKVSYSKRTWFIDSFKEVKSSAVVAPKNELRASDFNSNDIVSVIAKLYCGFKMLNSENMIKLIFLINYQINSKETVVAQVECSVNATTLMNVLQRSKISNCNKLLKFLHKNKDKEFVLNRIKCQVMNDFKSFSIQNITKIELVEEASCVVESVQPKINISRKQKLIMFGRLTNINCQLMSSEKGQRLAIDYNVTDSECSTIKGMFYNNDDKETIKLQTDINQMNDSIQDNLIKGFIYVACDTESDKINVMGVTRYFIDEKLYEGM